MHHIVCSLSEASKIAFLDLELLIEMHLNFYGRCSFIVYRKMPVYHRVQNLQQFLVIWDSLGFLELFGRGGGGRSFRLDLLHSFWIFVSFESAFIITCHHMKRPAPDSWTRQLTYRTGGWVALLINICLCSDGWSPQTGITRRQMP